MKLKNVEINNLRSVEKGELNNCGGFNVLIGKNNSGKSNILSAIGIFFECIKHGEILNLSPPINNKLDFFKRKDDLPIKLSFTFSLTLSERDELIRNIVDEAPQMKNAVDGLDPSLLLSLDMVITSYPHYFSYIKKVSLVDFDNNAEKVLLNINKKAASELNTQMTNYKNKINEKEIVRNTISKISHHSWDRTRQEIKERGKDIPLHYLVRGRYYDIDSYPELAREIRQMVFEATSFDDFKGNLQTYSSTLVQEADKILDKQLNTSIDTFAGQENSIPNYIINLLKNISDIKVHYFTESRKPIGKKEAEHLLRLKVKRGGNKILSNIQKVVSSLLGVKIDAFQSKSSREETSAEMDVDNFLVEVNGSGIREALRLVLDVKFEKPDIILVEEPEVHLHPSLEYSIMRFLKSISSDVQIFLTTHSTNFLDTTEMKNVYLISRINSTEIQHLNYEEAETLIPEELGIRLSSLFMYDRLVFVEGKTDEAVFKEFASTLGINLSQSNIGFIDIKGARNFTHYAIEEVLSFLTKRQVELWFVIDKDEKNDEEIEKLKNMIGDKAILKVLSKREIENYLIYPKSITKFIELKRELTYGKSNIEKVIKKDDVIETINKCVDNLKQTTINRYLMHELFEPIYSNRELLINSTDKDDLLDNIEKEVKIIKEKAEEINNKIKDNYNKYHQFIEEEWKKNKFNIVPGDELLDMICKDYDIRFKKAKDSSRLAKLVDKDHIDKEIIDIIEEWVK